MFYFLISISKFSPLDVMGIEKFLMFLYKNKAKVYNYIFWDINPKELTWDRYYDGEELGEIKSEEMSFDSLIKLLNIKYLNEFIMDIVGLPKITVTISPYNNLSYEISFSLDSEILNKKDEGVIKLLIEKLVDILEPNFLVSGIEESVLTINENNFVNSNNVYGFYASNSKSNTVTKRFQQSLLKDGTFFTNRNFFKNLNK